MDELMKASCTAPDWIIVLAVAVGLILAFRLRRVTHRGGDLIFDFGGTGAAGTAAPAAR